MVRAPSLVARLVDVPLAFVDVETTGASPELGDRVIEVGIAVYRNGQLASTYSQLLNPSRPLSPTITMLTGITGEMLVDQPDFRSVHQDILGYLRGAVIVGHNVPFDLGFLRAEFRKCSIDLPAALPSHPVLDTVRIARKRFGRNKSGVGGGGGGGGNGLQSLAARFGVSDVTAHRALADSLTTARVMHHLIQEPPLAGWQSQIVDLMQYQGGVVRIEGAVKKDALPLELEEALDRKLPVQLEYLDAYDQPTSRIITPLQVRKFRGELILLAFCSLRQDQRSFKLSRILRLTRIDPDSQVEVRGDR
jgi:DNA polymerase III epsilon subunit family exonuclease